MLLQFAVTNFLSFRERTVLSLLAADGVAHPPGSVHTPEGFDRPVLRTVALYGPNASGKSNLVKAWQALRSLVQDGVRPGQRIPVVPFKLDPACRGQPSVFELELFLDGERWSYGVAATAKRVVEEWLVRHRDGVERVVFERQPGPEGADTITWGPGLQVSMERRGFYGHLGEGTRAEQPLLAEFFERQAVEFDDLLGFISQPPRERSYRPEMERAGADSSTLTWLAVHREIRQLMQDLLQRLDTGVSRIEVHSNHPDIASAAENGDYDAWREAITRHFSDGSALELRFHHGNSGHLSISELSDGTQRVLVLALLLTDAARPLVLDELDRSLHTALAQKLVALHLKGHFGPRQLLFTTHDTNLLDAGLLGHDAVWFVEKDEHGASRLFSLAEFKADQLDQLTGSLEEGYLSGRFGAIPFLGDPGRLGWTGGSDEAAR